MRGRSVRASLPSPSAHTSGRRRRLLAVDARVAAAADAARALQHLPSPRLRPRPRLPPPPPARHSSFAAREQERERGCVPLRLEHAPARTRTNACHGDDGAPRPCARSTARSAHMCTCACYRIMCARRAPAAAPAGQRASAPPSAAARGRVTCTCTCTCTCTLRHSPPPARPAISACLLLGCVCLLAQNCRRSSPSRSPPRWLVSPTGAAAETFLAAALSPAGACAWHFPGRSRSRARFSRVACGHREATGPLAAAPPLGEALEALTARRSARSG